MTNETTKRVLNKNDLEEIADLSRRYGADPEYIVAGGGNTSVKQGDTLYIKPSGVALATIRATDFIAMDRNRIRAIFDAPSDPDPTKREEQARADLAAARLDRNSSARPSVETPMHEALDYKFVVHTHPNLVNGLTCGTDGPSAAADLLPDDMLWIDYIDPGHTLAMKIHNELAAYKKKHKKHPHVILLQNHGVIVGADTPQEIIDITDRLILALRNHVDLSPHRPFGKPAEGEFLEGDELDDLLLAVMPTLRRLLSTQERRIVRFDRSPEVVELLSGSSGRERVEGGTFSPDHIVYCKEKPAWIEFDPDDTAALEAKLEQAIIAFRTAEGYVPKVVLVKQIGMFASDTTSQSAENASVVFRDWIKVARHTSAFGGPRYLGRREADFIDNWEVEAYRRRQAKLRPMEDRPNPLGLDPNWARELEDKVVFITGAASGVGRVIAQACAFMGACPVCADLDADLLQEAADVLAGHYGQANVLAGVADITDERSVRLAFVDAVKTFGGVDAVINVPSLSPDGPADEMDIAAYEQALKVNLLGYAIVGKYAAKVMKKQGWGVGINMTSKSGLFPSTENNVYATTKAGEINQGHSFAAELGAFGIRWNNLALGNAFDVGSALWSDEHMTLRAKKKGIPFRDAREVREKVRAYYCSLNALNSEVTTQDIAYAVGFMLSDKSRVMSGHTMLLDGGQTFH